MLNKELKLIPGEYMNMQLKNKAIILPLLYGCKIGLHSEGLGCFGKQCCGKYLNLR